MNWELVKCEDLLDVRDGTHDSPKYKNEGYPLITSKNLINGSIDFGNVNYISEMDYININKRSQVHVGDILYSMIGSVGNYAIVTEEPRYAIKNVALFKFKDERLYNRFFLYLLKSPIVNNQIESFLRGGTQKFVSLKMLRGLKIPLPTLPEQKRIAQILDKADALRQKNKQLLAAYDELLQATFLDMFGDPAKNQNGFQVGSIKDLVDTVNYGTSSKADENGEYPYLRMNNITYEGSMDFSDLKYINLSEKDKPKYMVKKGDLLFNRTNSKDLVGKTAVYRSSSDMAIAGYIIRVRTNELGNSEYISAYLNSKHGKLVLKGLCKSIVGMANINAQELQKIKILIPPLELQNKYAQVVENIEAQKAKLKQSMLESDALFNALVQKAFKGELN